MINSGDLDAQLAEGGEFNIPLEMEIRQHVHKPGIKAPLVGKCSITFHCTPKAMMKARAARKAAAARPADVSGDTASSDQA